MDTQTTETTIRHPGAGYSEEIERGPPKEAACSLEQHARALGFVSMATEISASLDASIHAPTFRRAADAIDLFERESDNAVRAVAFAARIASVMLYHPPTDDRARLAMMASALLLVVADFEGDETPARECFLSAVGVS